MVPEGLVEACCSIKNRLLQFAKITELTPPLEADLKLLIADIGDFNRSYKKKKSKKKKRDEPKGSAANAQREEEEESASEDTDNINYPPVERPEGSEQ